MEWIVSFPRKLGDEERFQRMGCLIMVDRDEFTIDIDRMW